MINQIKLEWVELFCGCFEKVGSWIEGLKFESRHLEGCGLHDRVSVQHKALESLEELMLENTLVILDSGWWFEQYFFNFFGMIKKWILIVKNNVNKINHTLGYQHSNTQVVWHSFCLTWVEPWWSF